MSAAHVRLEVTPYRLPNGALDGYGFGWTVDSYEGQKRFWHNGETFGFASLNEYFPDLHEAVVVLLNNADASPTLISSIVFDDLTPKVATAASVAAAGESPRITALAREWMHRIQTGAIDRSQLTAETNKMFTPEFVAAIQGQFAPLGSPESFVYRGKQKSARGTRYDYRMRFKDRVLMLYLGLDARGKIMGILIQQP